MSATGLTGTSAPARNVDSTAGREPSLPMQLLRWMSVERGTMNRVFRGERSSDHDACPGTFPVLFSAESVLTRSTVSARMGSLPREDVIGEFTDLFQDACRRKDPEVMKGAQDPKKEGVRICEETIERLRAVPGVHGVHIMAIGWETIVPTIVQECGLVPRS